MLETAQSDCKPLSPPSLAEVGVGAPEPAKCRVGAMIPGLQGGWCLVRPTPACPFGASIGLGCLCRHPEIGRIIARTLAGKESRPG